MANEVEGNSAFCECNYIASHSIHSPKEDLLWSLGGRYDYRLTRTNEGWKISQCKIYVAWSSGDRQKFITAQTGAKTRQLASKDPSKCRKVRRFYADYFLLADGESIARCVLVSHRDILT